MTIQKNNFKSSNPMRLHGHVTGLVIRDCRTGRLDTILFNPSRSPWARGDGFQNEDYLHSLGCERLQTHTPDMSSVYLRYGLDAMIEAIVIKDLTANKSVFIRLSDLHLYPNVLDMNLYNALQLLDPNNLSRDSP